MTIGRRTRLVMAAILAACVLNGGQPQAEAADLDEQLRRLAQEIAGKAAKSRSHRLAVEPFTDLEGRINQMGRLLADELATELAVSPSVQIVDQRQLASYLEKRKVLLLSGLARTELTKAGRDLRLDGIVAGTVVESSTQIRLTVKLIALESGSLVAASRATLPKSGLLAELARPSAPPAKSEAPPAPRSQNQAPDGMTLVPAGPFMYGEGDRQRTITLPAFWIDLFEVTNARYAEFRAIEYDPIESHRPVTNVSWNQARQFCQSQGKRLPTEQEWEKAARGTDGRQYPWGNDYDPALVNAGGRHGSPTDVGKFEDGRSLYGLYDMAGNVWEWTDSENGEVEAYRGGSWASSSQDVRVTSGGVLAPTHRLPDLGFRCALDGPK